MFTRWSWIGLVASMGVAAFSAASCGSSNLSDGDPPPSQKDSGTSSDDDSGILPPVDAGIQLVVTPENPLLDLPGSGNTVQFKATMPNSTEPLDVIWSSDSPLLGTIDANGLFTASGEVGGRVQIMATYGELHGSTTLTVRLHIRENPGGIDSNTQALLEAGGSADASFRWLYPYDGTVFPRGLAAPLLQLSTDSDAVLVKISSSGLDYVGFYGGSSPTAIELSESTWRTISYSTKGPADPLTVSVTKISGGAVTGPKTASWIIAGGTLKGVVYYNSYDSPLGNSQGSVLRVRPGEEAEVLSSNCTVCHSVSGDGSTLVTIRNGKSASLDLRSDGELIQSRNDEAWAFAGVYPDGSMFMTNGTPASSTSIPGTTSAVSKLYDTQSGEVLEAPGWDGVIQYAMMPTFSPDGTKVAFNHADVGQGHTLSVMDFDRSTHTFSNLIEVAKDPAKYLGWPAFLPDSRTLLFHSNTASDHATWNGAKADIFMVDMNGTITELPALNGLIGTSTYLPYGPAEAHQNYEPTSLPLAVGGYYWVVFTSRRFYGHTITADTPYPTKKLWIAAIDIQPKPGQDPSHPAFYLPGQELAAGNMRGFWSLDPCKEDGNSCESGEECCSGACRQSTTEDGGIVFACVPPSGCAQEYEKCTTAADCCGASQGVQCINGYCARQDPN